MKLIWITATKYFFCFLLRHAIFLSASLEIITNPGHVRQTFDIFPEEAQYLWTQGFLRHSRHIFFHWMLLHNTNQPQQHSCGHGYVEHIQLQLGWASKALCVYPQLSQQMTHLRICRYPVADYSLSPPMQVDVCVDFVKNYRIEIWEKLDCN